MTNMTANVSFYGLCVALCEPPQIPQVSHKNDHPCKSGKTKVLYEISINFLHQSGIILHSAFIGMIIFHHCVR